ncbi:N-(5'-phosphoribosyl)anthranilate isomerase [Streptomyces nojiriensis]|uniref:N-(5'-phosphoribosyl)anthranilate isomerase n=1 Tax=Streptomyces nojiriensis TaxID=66374 RepID=A0ABQ3SX25_9ACTN|nr:phosphoribosylanthranilate isomerase [Streptomyces nojiriensis]QTI46209.1 N-(5'-phosphoribosyl)anthranilate isomerase [Streptomyces nojiriensis]GGR87217.1 N-(5'-phosphoribosyl)anthranilate isomerase [Streptomyces nojiriensis]GHI72687.1 N-(5'-phosphoribosyl)anthranilate isomerase [Streptomyces nojiriensis]
MSDLFVKICGLKTAHDVDVAVEAGADAVGFVFAPGSPRTVDAVTARELAARVPAGVLTVGVFRGQPLDEVRQLTEESGVRAVQLHGDEGPEYYEALRAEGRTLLRATAERVERCGEYGEDLLLIDAPDPGSGKPWNWGSEEFSAPEGRWLLAGGLNPGNVREAVQTTGAWGVDVSSGVERERGVKSPDLIRAFIEAARR